MAIKMIVMFSIIVSILNTEGLVSAAIISVPPVNAVGCYGGESIFYCGSAEGADIANIGWLINGANVANMDDTVRVARGISVVTSPDNTNTTLTIIGLPVNDGVITCTAVENSFEFDSKSAIFTVSDIPPVEDLSIDLVNNDTVMVVTWSPPSSCIPLYHQYRVNITNDTDTLMASNTTDTQYNMTVSQCGDNYTISVSVIDTYYTNNQSNSTSESITTTKINKAVTFDVLNNKQAIQFLDEESCFIEVILKVITSCSRDPSSHEFTYSITSISPPNIWNTTGVFNTTVYNNGSSSNITIGPVNERFIGVLSLTHTNTNTTEETNISTFNVQDFSVSIPQPFTGIVILSCYFATNSSANGCHVNLTSTSISNPSVVTVFIKRSLEYTSTSTVGVGSTSNITINDEGNYTITVYDVVDDIINTVPAYTAVNILQIMFNNILLEHTTTTTTSRLLSSVYSSLIVVNSSTTADINNGSIDKPSSSPPSISYTAIEDSNNSSLTDPIITSIIILVVIVVLIVMVVGAVCIVTSVIIIRRKRSRQTTQVNTFTVNLAYETVNNRIQLRNNTAYETVHITHTMQ